MQEFILNERLFCENILNSNDEIKNPRRLLNLIAQYYYQICGYRKSKVESLLKDFMEKRYPMYIKQKAKWDKVCASMARKTGGKNLLEIKGVAITHAELEAIQRANNKVLERLLFVMLCIAKLNLQRNEKIGGWVNTSLQTLCQCAQIGGNKKSKEAKMFELIKMGMVELPVSIDKINYRITFINDDSPIAIFVDDFRELGYIYERYAGRKIFECKQCGKLERYYSKEHEGLCKECIKALNAPKMRTSECVDCGESFTVDARVAVKCRCDKCQDKRNKEKKIAWKIAHANTR